MVGEAVEKGAGEALGTEHRFISSSTFLNGRHYPLLFPCKSLLWLPCVEGCWHSHSVSVNLIFNELYRAQKALTVAAGRPGMLLKKGDKI